MPRAISVRPRTDSVRTRARATCTRTARALDPHAELSSKNRFLVCDAGVAHTRWYASCKRRRPIAITRRVRCPLSRIRSIPTSKLGCGCGRHASAGRARRGIARNSDAEALQGRAVEHAVMRALFPARRDAAPLPHARSAAAPRSPRCPRSFRSPPRRKPSRRGGKIEKPNLKVGFIPITCAHADHHVAADGLLRPRRASTSTW